MPAAARSPLAIAFGGMCGMAAGMGIGRFVFTPLMPAMIEEIGLTVSQAGWLASANFLGYLLGAITASGGWAHGRERQMALVGVGGSAVLLALMATTTSFAFFLVIRFFAGLASAYMLVFLVTVVFSRLAEAGRSDLQALHFGGVGLGIGLSAALTVLMLSADAPWWQGWIGAAILSGAAFVAVLKLVPAAATAVGDAATAREPPLPQTSAMRRMILAYGLFGFGYVITATFLVAIVRAGDGGGLFEALAWFVTGVSIVGSTWFWNWTGGRVGLVRAYSLAMLVEAIGVMASVGLGGYVGPLVAAVLVGGTFVAGTAVGLQVGRQMAQASPRRALALMSAVFGVGQIIGPVFGGIVADRTGSFLAPSLVAVATLLASAALAWDAGRRSGIR